MRKCGKRVHGHPKNLTLEGGCCVWPFRAVLPCKPLPVEHGLLGGGILQCNSGHPLGISFVPNNISCSRGMHPKSLFPCHGSNIHHVRGWATGQFRIWPCKTHTDRNQDCLGPPATVTSEQRKRPTKPPSSPLIL